MKAIKKQIKRKFAIPTRDTEIITTKDKTARIAKAYIDVIIKEDDGSEYCMSRKEFSKRYNIIDIETAISKPNKIDFIYNTTKIPITFVANWGENITAYPNSAIVIENGLFSYAIQEKEFNDTYSLDMED